MARAYTLRIGQDGVAASVFTRNVSDSLGLTDARAYARAMALTDTSGLGDITGAVLPNSTITHGEQLSTSVIGPWTLQSVPKGTETLQTVTLPARGYWRFDSPDEFAPTGTYTYNNNTTNHGGVLATDTTIDGYLVPSGTRVIQFRDLSAGDFYLQGLSTGKFLFRGCRIRNNGTGDSSTFNDNTAASAVSIFMHYGDMGGLNANQPSGPFIKFLGGSGHRILRSYFSYLATAIQPNTSNVSIIETFIEKLTFYWGEAGPNGAFNNPGHLNGISVEGGSSGLTIQRCKILMQSPDESTSSGGTNAGQASYGSQPGQTGYGSGSNPGRLTTQTDCIAMFNTNGLANHNTTIDSNFLGGAGYTCYGGGAGFETTNTNQTWTNNKISTQWWTNGGSNGVMADPPTWGSNGNVSTGNVWADDYGTGGNGCTALANRQYPGGDGPRAGTTAF